jgi:Na+-transporting NADH:ubiquinone oxidoreductase subunit NqrF
MITVSGHVVRVDAQPYEDVLAVKTAEGVFVQVFLGFPQTGVKPGDRIVVSGPFCLSRNEKKDMMYIQVVADYLRANGRRII